jgi:hypothetical protein
VALADKSMVPGLYSIPRNSPPGSGNPESLRLAVGADVTLALGTHPYQLWGDKWSVVVATSTSRWNAADVLRTDGTTPSKPGTAVTAQLPIDKTDACESRPGKIVCLGA